MKSIQKLFVGMAGVSGVVLLLFGPMGEAWAQTYSGPSLSGCVTDLNYKMQLAENFDGGTIMLDPTPVPRVWNLHSGIAVANSGEANGSQQLRFPRESRVGAYGEVTSQLTPVVWCYRGYAHGTSMNESLRKIHVKVRSLPQYGPSFAIAMVNTKGSLLCRSGVPEFDNRFQQGSTAGSTAPLCTTSPTFATNSQIDTSGPCQRLSDAQRLPPTGPSYILPPCKNGVYPASAPFHVYAVKKSRQLAAGQAEQVLSPSSDLELEMFVGPNPDLASAKVTLSLSAANMPQVSLGGCSVQVNITPKILDFGVQAVRGAKAGQSVGQEKTFNVTLGNNSDAGLYGCWNYSNSAYARLYVNGRFTAVDGLLQNINVVGEGVQQLLVPSNQPGIAVQIKGDIASTLDAAASEYGEVASGAGGFGNIPLGTLFPLFTGTPTNPGAPMEMKAKLIWTTDKPTLGPWNTGLNLDVFYR